MTRQIGFWRWLVQGIHDSLEEWLERQDWQVNAVLLYFVLFMPILLLPLLLLAFGIPYFWLEWFLMIPWLLGLLYIFYHDEVPDKDVKT